MARIVGIDRTHAAVMPGVLAVLTGVFGRGYRKNVAPAWH